MWVVGFYLSKPGNIRWIVVIKIKKINMNGILLGFVISLVIVVFFELLKSFDRKLLSAFTLVAIAFIYIGFAWHETFMLVIVIVECLIFISLAYYGYKINFNLIVGGLVMHGIWDVIYPLFSSTAPIGYGEFCLTVDLILAAYFFIRLKETNN